jgi:hypothetical protein
MVRPAKRKRALLESNPLRNNRRQLIGWRDGKFKNKGFPSGRFENYAMIP